MPNTHSLNPGDRVAYDASLPGRLSQYAGLRGYATKVGDFTVEVSWDNGVYGNHTAEYVKHAADVPLFPEEPPVPEGVFHVVRLSSLRSYDRYETLDAAREAAKAQADRDGGNTCIVIERKAAFKVVLTSELKEFTV